MMKTSLITVILIAGLVGGGILNQAGALFGEGDYRNSTSLYLQALNTYPDRLPEIHYNLGICFLRQDSIIEAMRHFRAAINPRSPKVSAMAANEMGILLAEAGQRRDALNSFKEALIYNPSFELARYNYELMVRQLDPPTEPDDTPQAEESSAEDSAPLEGTPEGNGAPVQMNAFIEEGPSFQDTPVPQDTLTMQEALLQLQALKTRELQFFQQMVKSAKVPSRKTRRPDW